MTISSLNLNIDFLAYSNRFRDMPTIKDNLISMGLTETEATIYVAGLRKPSVTLQDLVTATKIKRPTVYYALHTLMEKGLVSETKEVNKSYFTMAAPETLRGLVEQQKEIIDDRMKMLTTLIPSLQHERGVRKQEEVSVTHYHGIQGMKMLIDMACYCTSKRWEVIAPYHNFLREYDKEYAQRYLRARKHHHIISRTLWERVAGSRKLTEEEIHERNPRYVPASMHGKFKSVVILFDDKVAIFSSFEKLSAILIHSQETHDMFRSMFDAIWEVSEECTALIFDPK